MQQRLFPIVLCPGCTVRMDDQVGVRGARERADESHGLSLSPVRP